MESEYYEVYDRYRTKLWADREGLHLRTVGDYGERDEVDIPWESFEQMRRDYEGVTKCENCYGSGRHPGSSAGLPCPSCGGAGTKKADP